MEFIMCPGVTYIIFTHWTSLNGVENTLNGAGQGHPEEAPVALSMSLPRVCFVLFDIED